MQTRISSRLAWLPLVGLAAVVASLSACSSRGHKSSSLDAGAHYHRCENSIDELRPLLVEWPSTDRSTLEAELARSESLIVVNYTGCQMEVLRGCELKGSYEWTEVSRKHDRIEIRNAADVWAKIPLAATKLVGAVERYGGLLLDMQLVGQYAGPSVAPEREDISGPQCERATHVVSSLTVGAFEITEASGTRAEAGVELANAGAGAGVSRHRKYISSDGDLATCGQGGGYREYGPVENCKSLLQIQLVPLIDAEPEQPLACPRDMALIETHPGAGFCLDPHEVTVHEYENCADDHTCSEAPATVNWPGIEDEDHERYDELCNRDRAGRRTHPVNCLTFDQAASYCRAQGKRLPTTHEWFWAANGGEQHRSYPWGEDTPDHRLANACGKECAKHLEGYEALYEKSDGFGGTAPVGSFPAGTARWDLMDMAGNVGEWASNSDSDYDAAFVLGGSAFSESADDLLSRSWESTDPSTRRADVGVRCALTAEPKVDRKRSRRGDN